MAKRRMFANVIVGSSRFIRMPPTARLLYYDLGMVADDDGYVEAYVVMRTTGADEDDLRLLEEKGFVRVLNEDLVTFITDWKANNQIKPDRYHSSVYKGLVEETAGSKVGPSWNQPGSKMEPESSLGKSSQGKSSQVNTISGQVNDEAELDMIWSDYPAHRRGSRSAAEAAFREAIETQEDAQAALANLVLWKRSDGWTEGGGKYVPRLDRWLHEGLWQTSPPAASLNGLRPSGQLGQAELEAIQRVLKSEDSE